MRLYTFPLGERMSATSVLESQVQETDQPEGRNRHAVQQIAVPSLDVCDLHDHAVTQMPFRIVSPSLYQKTLGNQKVPARVGNVS